MAKIYNISTPISGATLTAGTPQTGDATLALSSGVVIDGTILDESSAAVANAPVVLVEIAQDGTETIAARALTDASGYYIFGLASITANATYTVKTTTYSSS